jgi:two-component system, cell cycle response regulator
LQLASQFRSRVKTEIIKVLLVEDCATDAQLLRLLLSSDPKFTVTTATTLARGKAYLAQKPFDLLLLDLSLPDAEGIEAIHQMRCAARDLPIIALSTLHDEKLAVCALREGAQDYIVKAETDRSLLMRVIRYALERHRLVAALQSMALMDTLTGLYNRRGFVTVAEEQLKLARRTGTCFAIAFVDLDGMKRINDEMGHEFGDQALATTASILKSTFRASDITARLGGDEFVALAIGAKPSGAARIRKRLNDAAALCNSKSAAVPVAFSVGFAHYNPLGASKASIETLMVEADKAMYVEKQQRRGSRTFQEQQRAKATATVA